VQHIEGYVKYYDGRV